MKGGCRILGGGLNGRGEKGGPSENPLGIGACGSACEGRGGEAEGGGRLNCAKKAAVLAPRAAADGAAGVLDRTKGAELIFTLFPHPIDKVWPSSVESFNSA